MTVEKPGPLNGLRVVELAGLGPAPFAAMVLAGYGADVIRVDRPGGVEQEIDPRFDLLNRGRRSVGVNLKDAGGLETVLRLADEADVLLEGLRPGVAERLGLGPEVVLARNPGIIYGRMTGWGQEGPLSNDVGHDINYIALAGVLHSVGRAAGGPVPPLNLVGDFGGGSMVLLSGILAALYERTISGRGQVIDAAMVDGAVMLMSLPFAYRNAGAWTDHREDNLLDGGAPFYNTYECADGRWLAVGAIEGRFFAAFEEYLGIGPLGPQLDRAKWARMKERIAERLKQKPRDEWAGIFSGTNACVTPVLSMPEAAAHPHMRSRRAFVVDDEQLLPAIAPKFSRTPGEIAGPPALPGQHTLEALRDWGFSAAELAQLASAGAIYMSQEHTES